MSFYCSICLYRQNCNFYEFLKFTPGWKWASSVRNCATPKDSSRVCSAGKRGKELSAKTNIQNQSHTRIKQSTNINSEKAHLSNSNWPIRWELKEGEDSIWSKIYIICSACEQKQGLNSFLNISTWKAYIQNKQSIYTVYKVYILISSHVITHKPVNQRWQSAHSNTS